ncbi:MFS transporter [Pseudonocardia sp. H11422]|uniref:MDR family MFS transporter n=1 Tax=Pseudonocardia sp. H11422 TaxID=2835866 RepID=UPI0027E357CB|nr:MFS transporter [Pseudonocardia sp. H11422]
MTGSGGPLRHWATLRQLRELPGVARLLVATQLAFNIGFYLVLPYLASHLATELALGGAVVGFVLGLRTFSQQGLFVVGGILTDRFGAKPVIVAGCALRVAGFVLLGLATTLPGVLGGAVLTGFAAALFSPAVESSLATEAGELEREGRVRRSDVFALFAVAGEVGAVTGPLLGAALLVVDFRLVCLVAAAVFVVIGIAHAWVLPARPAAHAAEPVLAGWREVLGNRTFLLFAAGYSGYLLCYNQLYLALPFELRRATGDEAALGPLFALASLMIVLGQLPVASWARTSLGHGRGLVIGFATMSVAFLAVVALRPLPAALAPAIALVVLLTAGQMLAVPLAQDLVPRLAGERRLGSYFGVLSSAGGLAVLVGSTGTGALLDASPAWPPLPWLALAVVPLAGAAVLGRLVRRGALRPVRP